MTKSRSEKYRMYETKTLDTPLVHFLFEPLLPLLWPVLRTLYGTRSFLSRPLGIRLVPKCFPAIPIPGLKWIPYVTLGELLLTVPIIVLILVGYNLTFINPDLTASGDVAGIAIYMAFLTANKSNAVTSFLLGIPFERMIPFHNLSALAAVTLGCFHTYVAFVYGGDSSDSGSSDRRLSGDSQYSQVGSDPDFIKFCFDGGTNVSGSLLVLSMGSLVILSILPIIRRWFFDFWLWTHIGLAICTIIFCLLHSVSLIIIVTVWWMVDLVLRYLVMAGCRYPTRASIKQLRADVTEISFPKPSGFQYNAGQFVQIAIPRLSPIAFHPITISSAPHEENVTLHIRSLGRWSRNLYKLAQKQDSVRIMLEGPYGILGIDLDDDKRYNMALLVSGGIGVTPCQSIGKALLHDHHKRGRKLKKLQFVWTTRDIEMVQDMPPLAGDVLPTTSSSNDSTGETAPSESSSDSNKHTVDVQTDVFITDKKWTGEGDAENPLSVACPTVTFHSGRPDLDKIFQDLKAEAIREGETHVAVCGCGPEPLMHQLQEACRKHSGETLGCGGVHFDLHLETFEF